MKNWQQGLYNSVPWFLKEQLVAAEARRRNEYRRYGDYAAAKRAYDCAQYASTSRRALEARQLELLRDLVRAARAQSDFYRARLPQVVDLETLADVPVLTKSDVRDQAHRILDPNYDAKQLWNGLTSGSTGTPLSFPVGREGIRARYAIQDTYYALHGCRYGERRVRFGGAKVVSVATRRPPFWIMNRPDNQLQMSAYHIDTSTLPHYVRKLESFRPAYVTGYGHAQYQVAQYLCEHGGLETPPRALFTDSEGVPPEHREVIARGFGAPVYDVYGLGEVGWVAVHCRDQRYHVLQLSCILEVVDDAGRPLPAGTSGRLVVTDLTQAAFPYIRYDTGDVGSLSDDSCTCGMRSQVLNGIDGRNDDLVVTSRGRRVGRLSHVTKPGRGILESQIVQTDADRVVVRIVPSPEFDPESMQDVVAVARELLGEEMRVDWEIVDAIPRTSRHKFKHVVREYAGI